MSIPGTPSPALAGYDGQPIGGRGVAMPSPFKFHRAGQSGIEVSEVFPKLAEHVDEMADHPLHVH